MIKTETTTWGDLMRKDTIVCPTTERPERVLFARLSGGTHVHVRTTGHDHIRPLTDPVEIVKGVE